MTRGAEIEITVADFLHCPLTGKPFVDPVLVTNGKSYALSYERASYLALNDEQKVRCGVADATLVIDNIALKSICANWEVYKDATQVPNELLCPISQGVMFQPVIISTTGHSFQNTEILRWLKDGNTTDPLTGGSVVGGRLIPNANLKACVMWFSRKLDLTPPASPAFKSRSEQPSVPTRSPNVIQFSNVFQRHVTTENAATRIQYFSQIINTRRLRSNYTEALAFFHFYDPKAEMEQKFKDGIVAVNAEKNEKLTDELQDVIKRIANSETFSDLNEELEPYSLELAAKLQFDREWLIGFLAPRSSKSSISHTHQAIAVAWTDAYRENSLNGLTGFLGDSQMNFSTP